MEKVNYLLLSSNPIYKNLFDKLKLMEHVNWFLLEDKLILKSDYLEKNKIVPICKKIIQIGDNSMDPRRSFEDAYFYFMPAKEKLFPQLGPSPGHSAWFASFKLLKTDIAMLQAGLGQKLFKN